MNTTSHKKELTHISEIDMPKKDKGDIATNMIKLYPRYQHRNIALFGKNKISMIELTYRILATTIDKDKYAEQFAFPSLPVKAEVLLEFDKMGLEEKKFIPKYDINKRTLIEQALKSYEKHLNNVRDDIASKLSWLRHDMDFLLRVGDKKRYKVVKKIHDDFMKLIKLNIKIIAWFPILVHKDDIGKGKKIKLQMGVIE